MASQTITADFTTTISVPDDGDILLVAKGVNGAVTGVAIDATALADDIAITIRGVVEALDSAGDSVALLVGDDGNAEGMEDPTVTVGKSGVLRAVDFGIRMFADDGIIMNEGLIEARTAISGIFEVGTIVNEGRILGGENAIDIVADDTLITNRGFIRSDSVVVRVGGADNEIRNDGVIRILDAAQAVEFNSVAVEANTLINRGKILGGSTALVGREGDETIVNFGTLEGGVSLNGGNDVFVNHGTVTSTIFGGLGDDEYHLYAGKLNIGADSGGEDTVLAGIDVRLAEGIETLRQMGRKDIDGTGNGDKNTMTGNAGDNVLKGAGQNDRLTGGVGDDTLFGGTGNDIFFFEDGFGRDVIADLDAGDTIDLDGLSVATDFTAIRSMTRESGRNLVIDFGQGDRLTIRNAGMEDFDNINFLHFGQRSDE